MDITALGAYQYVELCNRFVGGDGGLDQGLNSGVNLPRELLQPTRRGAPGFWLASTLYRGVMGT